MKLAVELKNRKAPLDLGGRLRLNPGMNDVEEELLALVMRSDKIARWYYDQGHIVVHEPKRESVPTPPPPDQPPPASPVDPGLPQESQTEGNPPGDPAAPPADGSEPQGDGAASEPATHPAAEATNGAGEPETDSKKRRRRKK